MITTSFLSGVTMATFAASGLFFIKFWRVSRDQFFLNFALACWLLSIERIVSLFIPETFQAVLTTNEGPATWIFLFRVVAFGLIAFAIFRKNRGSSKGEHPPKKGSN